MSREKLRRAALPPVQENSSFLELLPIVRQHIIDGFTPKALDVFRREFDFFDKVTSISGVLFPLPKEERRAGIRRELEKIQVQGDDLYLPTAPNKLVRGIQVDSGIPLQSAAKVPIMITFNVVDRDGDQNDIKPQACIFKVGDDCRQDVLALQVIALLRDIFTAVGLNLYLFPYGALPTGPEKGIIEAANGCDIEHVVYEFFTQAFVLYEEEIADSKAQGTAIHLIIGTPQRMNVFGVENRDTLTHKATGYSARLLKKADQCRAVYVCSYLFWVDDQDGVKDEERVL